MKDNVKDASQKIILELLEHRAKLLYASTLPEIKGTPVERTFVLLAENVTKIIEIAEIE